VIKFVKRSGLKTVAVLGGEPVLHPDFVRIINRFLAEKLRVRLFTGGLVPSAIVKYLRTLDPRQINVVMNAIAPTDELPQAVRERWLNTLAGLGPVATPAFTVCDPDLDLRFLAGLVVQYGTRRSIRLGMALPRADCRKKPILDPSQYRAVAQQILRLSKECSKHGISIEFDCGFTLCMFSARELRTLRARKCRLAFVCSPIVDIGPDLSAWSCFPLVSLGRVKLGNFAVRDDLIRHFWKQQRPYRNFGVFEKCLKCKHKQRGECAGGCLAHVVRSFGNQ
jgi:MoaA/NifB/PqqE/SkfB family radical SAM enzyme